MNVIALTFALVARIDLIVGCSALHYKMECRLDFRVEAELSLKEVAYTIQEGELSHGLASSSSCAYINLTTKEGKKLTVRLSMRGFEVSKGILIY